jgi:hypothetical protein
MKFTQKRQGFGSIVGSVLLALIINGCDSKPQTTAVSKDIPEKYASVATLQGLVADDNGPVKSGVVTAKTEKGELLASTELDGSPRYSLEIPAGTELPLILSYAPSANAGEDQRMISVVVHAGASKFDINPLTTRITKQAKALGGYNHRNLVRAAEDTATVPEANKTTAGFRGDPTKQYGGWH